MFNQLVESSSHRADAKRRGSFFLGTLGLYALLIAVAGVASVYAYDAHLESATADEVAILITPSTEAPAQPRHTARASSSPAGGPKRPPQVAERPYAVEQISRSTQIPLTVSVNRNPAQEMPPGAFKFTDRVFNPTDGGALVPSGGNQSLVGDSVNRPLVVEEGGETTPPPPTPTPVQKKKPVSLPSSVITAKAIRKPAPLYPPVAKAVRAQGPVTVEILVDEQGRVVSAHATGGHSLLRVAAEQAARQALFSPTLLNGQPVKVTGVIIYNFMLQ
ncbi:MAG: energy transducer TonB [Pyrinomonadaceae bacterium]